MALYSGLGLTLLGILVFLAGSILLSAGVLLLGGGVWQANGFFGLGLGVPRDFTAENWAKTAPDYTDSPELLAYIIDMPFDESTLDIYLQNGRVTGTDRTLEH